MAYKTALATILRHLAQGIITEHEAYHAICNLSVSK